MIETSQPRVSSNPHLWATLTLALALTVRLALTLSQVPRFEDIFSGMFSRELPVLTRIVMSWWVPMLGLGIVCLGAAVLVALRFPSRERLAVWLGVSCAGYSAIMGEIALRALNEPMIQTFETLTR